MMVLLVYRIISKDIYRAINWEPYILVTSLLDMVGKHSRTQIGDQ